MFSLRYCKGIANLLFWVLEAYLALHNQSDSMKLQKTFMFICRQKIYSLLKFFWKNCKDMQTSYFRYFGHAQLCTPKMIYLQKTLALICKPKTNFITPSFLEILHFKESSNLIGQQHFQPKQEDQDFARYEIVDKILIILVFI